MNTSGPTLSCTEFRLLRYIAHDWSTQREVSVPARSFHSSSFRRARFRSEYQRQPKYMLALLSSMVAIRNNLHPRWSLVPFSPPLVCDVGFRHPATRFHTNGAPGPVGDSAYTAPGFYRSFNASGHPCDVNLSARWFSVVCTLIAALYFSLTMIRFSSAACTGLRSIHGVCRQHGQDDAQNACQNVHGISPAYREMDRADSVSVPEERLPRNRSNA